jgi:GNAT superfamily N-acetyltransferase
MPPAIRPATIGDIVHIQAIAHQTWPQTFAPILAPEQITYMLQWMYSTEALTDQIEHQGHTFLLAEYEHCAVGYASYEIDYRVPRTTKLHKLYVLPDMHGQRIGWLLIDAVRDRAKSLGQHTLTLNVNKHNPAIGFYERYGFHITGTEDIPIGNNYYMNDVIMELSLGDERNARFVD